MEGKNKIMKTNFIYVKTKKKYRTIKTNNV